MLPTCMPSSSSTCGSNRPRTDIGSHLPFMVQDIAKEDSLYDVSVSPPPQRNRNNTIKNFVSRGSPAQSSRAAGKPDRQLRHRIGSWFGARALVANMNSTPHQPQKALALMSASDRNRVVTNKRKGPCDYQAEADAEDEARDRADPTWPATQDTDIPEISRKRRKPCSTPRTPRIANKPSLGETKLYESLSPKTRQTRDRYITGITNNWGDPEHWMPQSVWLTTSRKAEGNYVGERQLLDDLRNCSSPFLEKLAELSDLMSNEPEKAYEALKEAVAVRSGGSESAQISKEDINQVIEQIRTSAAAQISQRTPTHAPLNDTFEDRNEPDANEVSSGMNGNVSRVQLPSPRSPTVVGDARIKQELPSFSADIHTASPAPESAHAAPDSAEMYTVSEHTWKKARTKQKRKLEIEDERLEIRDRRLEIQAKLLDHED